MLVLLEYQPVEKQRAAQQLNVRMHKSGVIAHQLLIHRGLDPPAYYRIEKVRRYEYRENQKRNRPEYPPRHARPASPAARRRRHGTRNPVWCGRHRKTVDADTPQKASKIDTA